MEIDSIQVKRKIEPTEEILNGDEKEQDPEKEKPQDVMQTMASIKITLTTKDELTSDHYGY